MLNFMPTGIPVPEPKVVATRAAVRRRQINPEAGRALEILGHAIEYLTDEFVHQGGPLSLNDGRLEAVQLLMARNRMVYLNCPEIPGLRERCLAFLRANHS
jgi:hypothetical protein